MNYSPISGVYVEIYNAVRLLWEDILIMYIFSAFYHKKYLL